MEQRTVGSNQLIIVRTDSTVRCFIFYIKFSERINKMNKNSNLHNAKKQKNDEFYTQLSDIENELRHYKQHFKGKVVFCNCDDPYESNFFKYFAMNFNSLGLKKLIATGYVTSPVTGKELSLFDDETDIPKNQPYAVYINEVSDLNGDGRVDLQDVELLLKMKKNTRRKLYGNDTYPAGDFRSEESIALLKQADVVVTNPPFSLAREYIKFLEEQKKSFLIIGDLNWITYKEVFPLLKNNQMWLGYNSVKGFIQSNGNIKKFGNKLWFTNLDIQKRHEILDLYKEYNDEEYSKYDNYDAINVNKVSEIPFDYDGVMGVPVTFLNHYNPEQFEIITLGHSPKHFIPTKKYEGVVRHNTDGTITKKHIALNQCLTIGTEEKPEGIYYTAVNSDKYLILPYDRLLIRRKYV